MKRSDLGRVQGFDPVGTVAHEISPHHFKATSDFFTQRISLWDTRCYKLLITQQGMAVSANVKKIFSECL